jgi:hypothetical protein
MKLFKSSHSLVFLPLFMILIGVCHGNESGLEEDTAAALFGTVRVLLLGSFWERYPVFSIEFAPRAGDAIFRVLIKCVPLCDHSSLRFVSSFLAFLASFFPSCSVRSFVERDHQEIWWACRPASLPSARDLLRRFESKSFSLLAPPPCAPLHFFLSTGDAFAVAIFAFVSK